MPTDPWKDHFQAPWVRGGSVHFTALTESETALGSSQKPGVHGEALSGGFSQRKPLFPNIHRQLFAPVLNGRRETDKMFLNPRPTCASQVQRVRWGRVRFLP